MLLCPTWGCLLTWMLKHIFRESQCTSMSAEQVIFLGTRQGGLQCGPPFQAQKKEVFSSPAPDNISESESSSVVSTLCNPMDYTLHGILQARILESVAFPFCRGSSQPRNRTQVTHIASLPAEPPWKSKETGVGSLSILQWIFPTQESNWELCIAGGFFTNWATREAWQCQGLPNACWEWYKDCQTVETVLCLWLFCI